MNVFIEGLRQKSAEINWRNIVSEQIHPHQHPVFSPLAWWQWCTFLQATKLQNCGYKQKHMLDQGSTFFAQQDILTTSNHLLETVQGFKIHQVSFPAGSFIFKWYFWYQAYRVIVVCAACLVGNYLMQF